MRVCTDNKDDPHYDPRPRRVWVRDREVMEPWVSADEFRRVVVLASGEVLNGAVHIEKLKDTGESEGALMPPAPNTGFIGTSVFVADTQAEVSAAPAPERPPAPYKTTTNFGKKK